MIDQLTIQKQELGRDIRFVVSHPDFPGESGELDLKYSGQHKYAATHTGVPPAMGGKGVGSALFRAMVEDAREQGYKVLPVCPFIVAKYKKTPEARDTMATRG